MHLNHEFIVPVPVQQAWGVLLDIERIAPCLPGATVESVEGDSFAGKVKVKVGPITVTYRGTATFVHRDEASGRATIRAEGREARGSGTAAATVEAVLHDEGEHTRVMLDTELAVTGRPAQFGRGVMVDVSNKLLGMFADCLERTLAADQAAPAAASGGPAEAAPGDPDATPAAVPDEPAPGPRPSAVPDTGRTEAVRPSPEAIDLLAAAGVPIIKRALPAVSTVVVLVLLWRILRRIRA
jgi:carbon monoxide dehydrogenase subunit G